MHLIYIKVRRRNVICAQLLWLFEKSLMKKNLLIFSFLFLLPFGSNFLFAQQSSKSPAQNPEQPEAFKPLPMDKINEQFQNNQKLSQERMKINPDSTKTRNVIDNKNTGIKPKEEK